ncbi:MAG: hypothetical protein ACO2ZZ_04340 [Cyclobacteriaceae bacterium]|jgi:hypothetical protein
MNKLVKTMALLLTVISGTATYASVDSVSLSSFCKVTALEDAQKYRVIYQAPETEDVNILLYDNKHQLIYSEVVEGTDGFAKIYDMTELADGQYTFELTSKSFSHSEMVALTTWKADELVISETEDNKVAMVGKGDAAFTLDIIDEDGNMLFSDAFAKDQAIQKLFNLQQIEGNQASFIIRQGNKIVKEEIVKL